jgi:hypothetical protein
MPVIRQGFKLNSVKKNSSLSLRRLKFFFEKFQFSVEKFLGGTPDKWKKIHPIYAPSHDMEVHFIIPLISKCRANSWEIVCRNLQRTLRSLYRQTSLRWTVTVCCQDRPVGIQFDEKVKFLRFPLLPETLDKGDKQQKLRYLIRHLSNYNRDGYIYYLDGDDILHPHIVKHITTDNNGHGYFVGEGYLVDLKNGKAVQYGFGLNVDYPFYILNGSVTALRFDCRKNRSSVYPAFMRAPHMDSHIRLKEFGFELKGIPFPAVLYVFNHGENLETHRNKDASKINTLDGALEFDEFFSLMVKDFKLDEADFF